MSRSSVRVLSTFALVFGLMLVTVPVGAGARGQVVQSRDVPCTVGWADDHMFVFDQHCSGTNSKTPDGGYVLVLHGQIQPGDLVDFEGPTSYETSCAVNYLFWREGIDTEFVHTTSVRTFTAEGMMTETCVLTPSG